MPRTSSQCFLKVLTNFPVYARYFDDKRNFEEVFPKLPHLDSANKVI